MVEALARAPDGEVLGAWGRPSERRATLTAKGAQIRTRWVTEEAIELAHDYPPGTTIEIDGAIVSTWDGEAWLDAGEGA